MTRRIRRPSPALLVACLALFVALGGPAYAKKLLVGARNIKRGAVSSKHVNDRSLRVQDLSRRAVSRLEATPTGTVGALQLLDGSVTEPKLAPASVTTAALGLGAVTGPNIQDDTIGLADMGENSVGGGKIRNGAVHKEDIAQQSVGTQELAGTRTAGAIPAGRIGAGTCSAAVDVAVTPAPPPGDTTGVLDDVVIGGRSTDWPADLSLRVQPVDPGTVRAYACHTQPGDDDVTLDAPLPFTVLTITA